MNWQKSAFILALLVALAIGVGIGASINSPLVAQGGAGGNAPSRYNVIETEGVHLIVTDNQKNTVFFYTVNEGDKPGDDLHLRGTIDLGKVGDAVIKPTLLKSKK